MKLAELKKLHHQNPDLIVQIFSNSYSGYCIRAKVGNVYHALTGWFGRLLRFDSLENAKQYLQQNTAIRYVYLIQSLPQDEVDPKKEQDYDLGRVEEEGVKIDLQHE